MIGATLSRISRQVTRVLPPQGEAAHTQRILHELLMSSVIVRSDWEALPAELRDDLTRSSTTLQLLGGLVEQGLLTEYQATRVEGGKTFGLILGNYRVLDRIGCGAMGVVFQAEHLRLRRQVAVKVLTQSIVNSNHALIRFDQEMQAVAGLSHPNIVAAIDAGEVANPSPDAPNLHYFVMEYVPGQDLEQYVETQGPLPPGEACEVIYQVASALAEAHKQGLIHRDLKPSNIRRTPEGQAKLLDFGLAQHLHNRMTQPGTILGTFEYMAPEQGLDASCVDCRADIYGLGATLYWCLTGQPPFPMEEYGFNELIKRQTLPAPSVRARRPGVPAELDALVSRMMASRPDDRYPTPQAVMNALLSMLPAPSRSTFLRASAPTPAPSGVTPPAEPEGDKTGYRLLLVDDEAGIRQLCEMALSAPDVQCDQAADGHEALAALAAKPYDLVVLDVAMPGISGLEVCRKLRANPPWPHLKIILCSGHMTGDEMAEVLAAGADDFLTKPFSTNQLRARTRYALRLKESQDQADKANRHLQAVNQQQGQHLIERDSDLMHARQALVLSLVKLLEHRQLESGRHLKRLQAYGRCLAEEAVQTPIFASQIGGHYVALLECCIPLHDIGKVGLPDHIVLKPGKLDAEERVLMQTHATIGSDLLKEVASQHGTSMEFFQMAIDITRHHHERYDGKGYPDRLAGEAIPLSARLLALADVYDALRSRQPYKPALGHNAAVEVIVQSEGQFDPVLVQAFQRCHLQFDKIFRELPD
jgi:response regulator RpfG family c-di-GMP phosphodiesterase